MVTVNFINNEASSLRGFYYADQIPQELQVTPSSVKINGNAISNYVFESGSAGEVYPSYVPYRWILETPTNFSENNPIPSGSYVEINYLVTSAQAGAFNLDQFNWVGYYQGGSRGAFGYSQNVDKKTIRFFETAAPLAATLVSPSPSTTITSNIPSYSWNEVPVAEWYHLWVNDSTGNKINQWYKAIDVCSSGTCSVTPNVPFAAGAGTWWVQTWNSAGYGPWSLGMSFTVGP